MFVVCKRNLYSAYAKLLCKAWIKQKRRVSVSFFCLFDVVVQLSLRQTKDRRLGVGV